MQVGGKPLGYYKSKTEILQQFKQSTRQIQQKNRFQKDRFTKQSATQSNLFGNSTTSSLTSNGNKESLLIKDKPSEDQVAITIELKKTTLPPEWVDYYEVCIQKLHHIEQIQQRIAEKGRERMKRGFGDNSTLDNQIYDLTREANSIIKECEHKIQQIDEVAALKRESASEQQIRRNVKSSLAQQISDITIRLRKQQKAILDTLKKNGNQTDDYNNTFMPFNDIESQKESQTQVQDDIYEEILKGRESDINQIVDQINELSDIYKTLGVLVIDQGTLLDRIDFNITETKNNVTKAKKHLAAKAQESPFASRVINTLIGFIIFFSIILVLKYTS